MSERNAVPVEVLVEVLEEVLVVAQEDAGEEVEEEVEAMLLEVIWLHVPTRLLKIMVHLIRRQAWASVKYMSTLMSLRLARVTETTQLHRPQPQRQT